MVLFENLEGMGRQKTVLKRKEENRVKRIEEYMWERFWITYFCLKIKKLLIYEIKIVLDEGLDGFREFR